MTNSTPEYYGGKGSELGIVRRLSPNNWSAFVSEVLGNPVRVNVTRSQYHALPRERQAEIKRVNYVVPCAFNASPTKRITTNATVFHLVVIDIDDPAQAAPFAECPGLLCDALHPHPFAAHLTLSSTPQAPRMHIFVACEPTPIARYPQAARYIAQCLGLDSPNKESTIPVQPMYLPTMFQGEDPSTHHPLLIVEEKGDPLSFRHFGATPNPSAPSSPEPTLATVDDLDFLRPTLEGVTLEDVKDALNYIDPDAPYEEWFQVAAAMKHQFPRDPDCTHAYELFNEWSSKGTKYPGRSGTLEKWKQTRATPRGRSPITIRSLFMVAKQGGWSNAAVSARAELAVRQWLTSPARTLDELKQQGVRRIAAAAVFDKLVRADLVNTLKEALRRYSFHCTISSIKSSLAQLESKLPGPNDKPVIALPDNQLPPWARGICFVSMTDSFYDRVVGRTFSPGALDRFFSRYFKGGDEDRPGNRPQDYLLNVANIPTVHDYRYSPAHADDPFFEESNVRYVNTYHKTYPAPDPTTAEEAGKVLLEHLCNLISEPEYRATVMDFFAYHVQCPGQKIRWALLLQGAQGCGKTLLADMLEGVLGREHVRRVDNTALNDKFTDWVKDHQVVVLDEAVAGNHHDKADLLNKLKPFISNDRIPVRGFKEKGTQVPNVSNYIFLTNYQNSVSVSEDDRRYFVVFSALQDKAQVAKLGPNYFTRIADTFKGNPAGMRSFLMNWKIRGRDKFDPDGHAPMTKYLTAMSEASSSPLMSAVRAALNDPDQHPLVQVDVLAAPALRGVVELDNVGNFTDQGLANILRELGYVSVGRHRINGHKQALWTHRSKRLSTEQVVALITQRAEKLELGDL